MKTYIEKAQKNRSALLDSMLWVSMMGAAILRIHTVTNKSLWYDEACSLVFSSKPIETIIGHQYALRPLYFILLRAWTHLWGNSIFSARLFSVVCGVLSLYVLYKLVREMFSQTAARIAVIILMCSPLHIIRCQQIRYYSLVMLLGIVVVYLFWRLWQAPSRKLYGVYALAFVMLFYTHFWEAALLGVVFSSIHCCYARRFTLSWGIVYGSIAVGTLPLIGMYHRIVAIEAVTSSFGPFSIMQPLWWIIQDFSFGKFLNQGGIGCFPRGGAAIGEYALLLLYGLLIVYGLYSWRSMDQKEKQAYGVLWLWMLIPVLFLTEVIARFIPFHKWAKMAIIAYPAFVVLIAASASTLSKKWKVLFCGICIGLSWYVLYGYYYGGGRESWKEIAAHIRTQATAGDMVLFMPLENSIPFWCYYDPETLSSMGSLGQGEEGRWEKGKWTLPFQEKGIVFTGSSLARLRRGAHEIPDFSRCTGTVWVIVSPDWIGVDHMKQMKQALSMQYMCVKMQKFPWDGVHVLAYLPKEQ